MKRAHLNEVCHAFSKLKTLREAFLFLQDILTPKEIATISQRFQIFKLLSKGTPHRTISKTLHVSIAKVTRGSHAWRKSKGAVAIILKRV